jgi:pimeloyl-ACP methyl ester carboxylesterase
MFEDKAIGLSGENAKYSVISDHSNTVAHFFGANSFPPACYTNFLQPLSEELSISMLWDRALWPDTRKPKPGLRWIDYTEDLINYLETKAEGPVVGIGHSMGASATLMAAARRPDLFSRLILIEPVIQNLRNVILTRILPMFLKRHLEPAKSALLAPQHWPSETEAINYYRSHSAYKRFNDDNLTRLVMALTESNPNGIKLRYGRDWEIANYLGLNNVWPAINKLRVPTVVLRGKPSLFLSNRDWGRYISLSKNTLFFSHKDFGHLIPMEAPELCAELVLEGLKQLNKLH